MVGYFSPANKNKDRFVVQSRFKHIVEDKVKYYVSKGCKVLTNPEVRMETTRYGDAYYVAVLQNKEKEKSHS